MPATRSRAASNRQSPASPGLTLSPIKANTTLLMDQSFGEGSNGSSSSSSILSATSVRPKKASARRSNSHNQRRFEDLDDAELEELAWKENQKDIIAQSPPPAAPSARTSAPMSPLLAMSPNIEVRKKRSPRKVTIQESSSPFPFTKVVADAPEEKLASAGLATSKPLSSSSSSSVADKAPRVSRTATATTTTTSRLPRRQTTLAPSEVQTASSGNKVDEDDVQQRVASDQRKGARSTSGEQKETREERRRRLGLVDQPKPMSHAQPSATAAAPPVPSVQQPLPPPPPLTTSAATAVPLSPTRTRSYQPFAPSPLRCEVTLSSPKRRLTSLLEFSPSKGRKTFEYSSNDDDVQEKPSELLRILGKSPSPKRKRSSARQVQLSEDSSSWLPAAADQLQVDLPSSDVQPTVASSQGITSFEAEQAGEMISSDPLNSTEQVVAESNSCPLDSSATDTLGEVLQVPSESATASGDVESVMQTPTSSSSPAHDRTMPVDPSLSSRSRAATPVRRSPRRSSKGPVHTRPQGPQASPAAARKVNKATTTTTTTTRAAPSVETIRAKAHESPAEGLSKPSQRAASTSPVKVARAGKVKTGMVAIEPPRPQPSRSSNEKIEKRKMAPSPRAAKKASMRRNSTVLADAKGILIRQKMAAASPKPMKKSVIRSSIQKPATATKAASQAVPAVKRKLAVFHQDLSIPVACRPRKVQVKSSESANATSSNTDVPEGYRLNSAGNLVVAAPRRRSTSRATAAQPYAPSAQHLAKLLAAAEDAERLRRSRAEFRAHGVPKYIAERRRELKQEEDEQLQRQIEAVRARELGLDGGERGAAATASQAAMPVSSPLKKSSMLPPALMGLTASSKQSGRGARSSPSSGPGPDPGPDPDTAAEPASLGQQPKPSSSTTSSRPFVSATSIRLAERAAWEAKRAARDALLEAERAAARAERERLDEEELKRERERRVPKANPVPKEIYGHVMTSTATAPRKTTRARATLAAHPRQ